MAFELRADESVARGKLKPFRLDRWLSGSMVGPKGQKVWRPGAM